MPQILAEFQLWLGLAKNVHKFFCDGMNPIIDNTNQVGNIIELQLNSGSTDMTTYNGSVYEAEWYLELEMWKFWQTKSSCDYDCKKCPQILTHWYEPDHF